MSKLVPLTRTPHNLQPNVWNQGAALLFIRNSEVRARTEITYQQNTEKRDFSLRRGAVVGGEEGDDFIK